MQAAEHYRANLLSLAWRMTNSREDAEDIVQLALTKAFANLSRFRGESQMSTWLHVIVKNAALEFLRNRRGRSFLPLGYVRYSDEDPIAQEIPDPCKNPEEYCRLREMKNIFIAELGELDSECRLTMQLCVLDELPQLEVANTLNIGVNTVKARMFRGKRMMKRAICLRVGKGRARNYSLDQRVNSARSRIEMGVEEASQSWRY